LEKLLRACLRVCDEFLRERILLPGLTVIFLRGHLRELALWFPGQACHFPRDKIVGVIHSNHVLPPQNPKSVFHRKYQQNIA
jgi:hypothetical protein